MHLIQTNPVWVRTKVIKTLIFFQIGKRMKAAVDAGETVEFTGKAIVALAAG